MIVEKDIEEFEVDGVRMIFQNTPNTEAPSEMNTYIPEMKALWMAENVIATLHNIYTLARRTGARSAELVEVHRQALYRFGLEAEVMFASHHWPRWGNERIQEVLRGQRDLYAHMNNQVLHLANQGVTINEIHNVYELPKSLQDKWYCRGYHGSPQHNSRGVIQRYLGFWDCNPATLIPLSPAESAPLYVEMMGGAEKILARGQQLHDEGKYLLAQEIVNKLVQAEPQNQDAKDLLADIFEQIGYQQENPGLRNSFLAGAYELRTGHPARGDGQFKQPRRHPGDVDRIVPQLPGHPHGQPQGRGHAVHDQPRSRRTTARNSCRAGERHADEPPGLPGREARPDADDQSRGPGADDDGRENARGPDRGRHREGGGRLRAS